MAPKLSAFSDDVLKVVLDCLTDEWDKIIPIDRREYLSKESFVQPPPVTSSGQGWLTSIGNLRRTCRRFAVLGAPYQWSRVTTRYSLHGFRRLDQITRSHGLVQHTKKFSLMVPFFYAPGHDNIEGLFELYAIHSHHPDENLRLDSRPLIQKRREQQDLVHSENDVKVLIQAFKAFASLQHVQILPLVDNDDRVLLELLKRLSRRQDFPEHLVQLEWAPACYHAARGLGRALSQGLSQNSLFHKFSAPLLNSNSAVALLKGPQLPVSYLAQRLTCLEIQFEAEPHLREHILGLSELFESLFKATPNMQLVHIGFPSGDPLDIRLEKVFHNVQWKRLQVFGIQSWRLDADEITDMAVRHSRSLRGLRLRDVLLNQGSRWKDVLSILRDEMQALDWISLRRVDYATHFDEIIQGTEILDVDLYPSSGSTADSEEEEILGQNGDLHGSEEEELSEEDTDEEMEQEESDEESNHGFGSVRSASPAGTSLTSTMRSFTLQGMASKSADELGDNGKSVGRRQITKAWEHWVIAPRKIDQYSLPCLV
ncbi:MAG: hypothetical protein Q9227_000824 [Pyrenula ochraceoflavens]